MPPKGKARISVERTVSDDGFLENAYVLSEPASRECLVVDPGASAARLISYVEEEELHVKAILATHGHIDHVVGVPRLIRRFSVPFMINRLDSPMLDDLGLQASAFGYDFDGEVKADGFFDETTTFRLGPIVVSVMHTPGHTPGSSCFMAGEGDLITGDTLFAGSIGRTDLPGGSPRDMANSLRRLAALPASISIYPGHGEGSSIGAERARNPFLAL